MKLVVLSLCLYCDWYSVTDCHWESNTCEIGHRLPWQKHLQTLAVLSR